MFVDTVYKKKREKEERKGKGNQFLYSSMSLRRNRATSWHQRTQWISIPTIGRRYPLLYFIHTHYQTHANGDSNRVTGGANPRVAAAWRGGADLPPTQLIHSFYIILHARSFSRSVDRVLSGSRRRISGCIARLHSPSDSPSAIRFTIHHPIYHPHFVASWIALRPGWVVLNVGWVLREPTGQDSIPRPPEVPACVQVVAMLRLSSGLKWPRTATLSVIPTLWELNHSYLDLMPNLRYGHAVVQEGPGGLNLLNYRSPRHPLAMSCVRSLSIVSYFQTTTNGRLLVDK